MWQAIMGFIGGPIIKGLLDAYNSHLKAATDDKTIAADLAGKEIAAQTLETQAITQYRIASIGAWYEPEKIMGYTVAFYFAKLLIYDKCFGWGVTDPLLGWSGTVATAVVGFYFGKRTFENVARIIKK